jgi:ELWxxDGT repeat protein
VVDTPGGVLLLTNDEFSFWNARQGRFQPVALPEPTPTAQAPTVRAVVGDTVWVTTPSNSTVAIDAPSGLVLRTLPTTDTLVTPFGTLLDSQTEPVWESLDGSTSRFDGEPSVARRPTVKQGSGAVWLVGLQVQVTTGGPRVLLEFVSGLDWADAEAIGTTLVSVRDGGLEVLDADGGRRSYEVPVLDVPRRFGDRLWFTGWDEAHGAEPWFFDGTQPRLAADVLPGPRSSFPQLVGSFDRGVVLQAMRDDGRNGGVALLLDPPLERLPPLPLSPGSGCGCGAAEAAWLPALALLLGRRRAKSLPRR